jgi:hypothetical protein
MVQPGRGNNTLGAVAQVETSIAQDSSTARKKVGAQQFVRVDAQAMDLRLSNRASTAGGFFSRAEALDCGYNDRDIRAAIRAGEWVRVKRGFFVHSRNWATLNKEEQHVVRARIAYAQYGDVIVFSHHTSCAIRKIDLWGHDLTTVTTTRLDGGSGRNEAGVHHHVGNVDPDRDVEMVDGLPVTIAERGLWESALETSTEGAVVSFDSGMHRGATTPEGLASIASLFDRWPRSRHVRLALRLADGLSESVGESRTRFMCWAYQLPKPTLQFEVRDSSGVLIGRCDFAWEEYRHLGEFDGLVKYQRSWRKGEDASATVIREKTREDLLRAELWGMSRLIWLALQRRRQHETVLALIRDLDRSRQLFTRNRCTISL